MKKCIFIMPYFGKFPNYFSLFLKSCACNKQFQWLIFTDDDTEYAYPENVTRIRTTLECLRHRIQKKFDFQINLSYAYKLCDFRPAYGYLFEKEIRGYSYWGYCDCDLIFGNLDRLLLPLLNRDYDKLFASGHMTIFKNTEENNLRFLHPCHGKFFYRAALTSAAGCWFDEDYHQDNIHTIFLEEHAKVYSEDLCLNPAVDYSQFRMAYYKNHQEKFGVRPYQRALYIWRDGELEKTQLDGHGKLVTETYLYMHFQLRSMTYRKKLSDCSMIQIYPNGFRRLLWNPKKSVVQWYMLTGYSLNLHYFQRKWKNLKKRIEKR